MSIQVIILAAGLGKRMHSQRAKVLHTLAGKSMLEHVIATANQVANDEPPIVVYGHQGEMIKAALAHMNVKWVEQKQQLGTGHAVLQALTHIPAHTQVLILYGDVPLTSVETLKKLINQTPSASLGMLTANVNHPTGYGRIKRDTNHQIMAIVEEKDATPEERAINEINPGIYLVPIECLQRWLPTLKNNNGQGEYYLTDIISLASKENISIHSEQPQYIEEIQGVNDRLQLAQLERFYQRQQAEKLLLQGVTIYDPTRFDLRGEVHVGCDVSIDINVILEGRVVLGDGCIIGANSILRNTTLGARVAVRANSLIDGAEIAADCVIGPFARIRPGTVLAARAHVGNFVEIKNSAVGEASKINHLSYIGDSEVGAQVNIGAGTITCNYDGVNKHKTVIGDHAFIGSNTALVAPVSIGENATIGAGSTITHDAPMDALTVARAQQVTKAGWTRPKGKTTEKQGLNSK